MLLAKASDNFTSFSQSLPIVQCPTSTHALKMKVKQCYYVLLFA